MSRYTDYVHERAIRETIYWTDHTPKLAEEWLAYGRYLWDIKEMAEAKKALLESREKGCREAAFDLGVMALDTDREAADAYLLEYQTWVLEQEGAKEEGKLGFCFRYGKEERRCEEKATELFRMGAQKGDARSLYEMGKAYALGEYSYPRDWERAHELLMQAYEKNWENAIFTDFYHFPGDFEDYPCQREIKEAYSFLLGQYMRMAEKGSEEGKRAVAALYRRGYPGDTGEKKMAFQKRAKKYED